MSTRTGAETCFQLELSAGLYPDDGELRPGRFRRTQNYPPRR
jgi:hypothetical protein